MSDTDLPRPTATRLRRPSWRDSRLLVGVLIVLLATLLGAKTVASADDRVPMYAAAVAIQPGDRLGADNLRRVDVQLAEQSGAYLSAATTLAPETYALREVRAGELVPRSAVGSQADVSVQPLTIRVEANSAAALVRGSVVDVWISERDPATTQERYQTAKLALRAVSVAAIPADQGRFGVTASTSSVQLLVPQADVQTIISAQDKQARFTLVPVPGSARSSGA